MPVIFSRCNAKEGGFRQAVALRAALFEAAGRRSDKEATGDFPEEKRGSLSWLFDTAPVFKIFGNYLKEDRINATPTCVIVGPQGKQTLGEETIPSRRSAASGNRNA